MAQYVTVYRCPDCDGKFKWPRDIDPPTRCQLCDSWMSVDEPPFEPKAPALRNGAIVKAVEDVYYAMEDGSKHRAEQMAALTPGASASDFSHTLITDMNDRQKPGDIAWKAPPPNPVSQAIQSGRGGWQGLGGATPAEAAAMAHQGPDAHAGARAAAVIQAHHMRAAPPFRTIGTYMPPKT
jgi:hypothetical protein